MEFFALMFQLLDAKEKLSYFGLGQVKDLLQELGEVEYRSAIAALDDAKKSGDPHRELESAITVLRTAYEAFYSSASPRWYDYINLFRTDHIRITQGYHNAFQCAAIIAVLYHVLGERALSHSYLQKARMSNKEYHEKSLSLARYMNKKHYYGGPLYTDQFESFRDRDNKQLEELSKRLGYYENNEVNGQRKNP